MSYRILYRDYVTAPARVLIQDPCPVGLPSCVDSGLWFMRSAKSDPLETGKLPAQRVAKIINCVFLVRTYLYIYIRIHTYIHTYIHTCMHAYIHTFIHVR